MKTLVNTLVVRGAASISAGKRFVIAAAGTLVTALDSRMDENNREWTRISCAQGTGWVPSDTIGGETPGGGNPPPTSGLKIVKTTIQYIDSDGEIREIST